LIVVIFVINHGFSAFKNYCYNFDIPNSDLNPEFDPTLDDEFCEIFMNTIKYSIMKPVQQIFPLIDKSKFIFCMDCPRKNIWRREFYPEYKIQRDLKDTSKDKFNINRMFRFAYEMILPNICEEYGALRIASNCAEGDDVIAVLTKYFLNETKDDVIIISCDKDMVQLCSDRVTLITADGTIREPKKEIESALKCKFKSDVEITANDFLLFKILIGDHADNIPNVKPGVGPKKAWKYVEDKKLLKELLSEDITIANGFLRNKKLISMNEIPQDIHNLIIDEYKETLNNSKEILI
jgi:5'-3' exonuclease